jgi:uncharacterized protein YkvS
MSRNFIVKIESLIPQLTVDELIFLNRKIVERIKFMQKARAMTTMQKFNIGDLVSFKDGDETVIGKVVRFNQRTVSLITDTRVRWNVAPALLTRINQD